MLNSYCCFLTDVTCYMLPFSCFLFEKGSGFRGRGAGFNPDCWFLTDVTCYILPFSCFLFVFIKAVSIAESSLFQQSTYFLYLLRCILYPLRCKSGFSIHHMSLWHKTENEDNPSQTLFRVPQQCCWESKAPDLVI